MSSDLEIEIDTKIKLINGTTTIDQLSEIKNEVLKISFLERTVPMHKFMNKFNYYNDKQRNLLDIARCPFYGRSDSDHQMLQNSGFYID